jgi:hypothetical protein
MRFHADLRRMRFPPVDEAAVRNGAGVEEETTDANVAYARFPEPEPTRYRDGRLPG